MILANAWSVGMEPNTNQIPVLKVSFYLCTTWIYIYMLKTSISLHFYTGLGGLKEAISWFLCGLHSKKHKIIARGRWGWGYCGEWSWDVHQAGSWSVQIVHRSSRYKTTLETKIKGFKLEIAYLSSDHTLFILTFLACL